MTKLSSQKNPYKISLPALKNGKQYIVPDIHGCCETFIALLDKIKLQTTDQLILLGDYIERGPNSKGVVDSILELINEGYQVFPIRGNHDNDFINSSMISSLRTFYQGRVGELIHDDNSIEEKYIEFFENLGYFIETDTHLFVHGGFNMDTEDPFVDISGMLWKRPEEYEYDKKVFKNKVIVAGHTPHTLEHIQKLIKKRSKKIVLDNGCVFKKMPGYGNLLCLELPNYKLHIQENIE